MSTLTEDMMTLLSGDVASEFQDVELMLDGNPIRAHKVSTSIID